MNKPLDTELLDRAITFAVKAHAGTERRGKGFPYVVHPLEAVTIVATMTSDQELLAAAALHDTVEDTAVTVDDIRREFGARVAAIVETETDTLHSTAGEKADWYTRKRTSMERLANASREVKMVAMGDKLSNMRAIWRDYKTQGDEFWKLFSVKDKQSHEWHYRTLASALSDLEGTEAYAEFTRLVDEVF